jgi:ribonuclease HI
LNPQLIKVYTDGSCHTQLKIGTWGAIVFVNEKKFVISGSEKDTSHNRMELLGIIRSIDFLKEANLQDEEILIYTDSQYAVNLRGRKEKLVKKSFITNKGSEIRNLDLVKQFLQYAESYRLVFTKVKAHSKDGDAINREVDLLVRNQLRKIIRHERTAI